MGAFEVGICLLAVRGDAGRIGALGVATGYVREGDPASAALRQLGGRLDVRQLEMARHPAPVGNARPA